MIGDGDIRRLEASTNRSWPPSITVRGQGWEIRHGDGLHRRRNSATAWPEASGSPETIAAQTSAHYAARGAEPVFKVTAASKTGLDDHLDASGWSRRATTIAMEGPVSRTPPDPGVTLDDLPSDRWTATFSTIAGYSTDTRVALARLLDSIELPCTFAAIEIAGTPVAVGMSVIDGPMAGLFEIATAEQWRGHGFARRIVAALMRQAAQAGAATAYLQVVESNTGAIALYADHGFTERYRYWYRIAPRN